MYATISPLADLIFWKLVGVGGSGLSTPAATAFRQASLCLAIFSAPSMKVYPNAPRS